MYRNYRQLRDGWTKNLALLFPRPVWLAAKTLLLWAIPWTVLALVLARIVRALWWDTIFVAAFLYLTTRTKRANFTTDMNLLAAFFGMPMFAYLLLRSKRAHAQGRVPWKGRTYSDRPRNGVPGSTNLGRDSGSKTVSVLESHH